MQKGDFQELRDVVARTQTDAKAPAHGFALVLNREGNRK